MRRLASDLRASWQFLRTGLRQFDKNASLFPSSRFLVDAMVSAADIESAKCVVEFGPGTGAVTEEIVKRLPPDGHVHAIELDRDLLSTTTSRLQDPRIRGHHGSAADADKLVRESGCTLGARAVISSLGLAFMSEALRADILMAAEALLLPGSLFVQYSYPTGRLLTYQPDQGWSQFDARKFLRNHFRDVTSKTVLLNAPPATVHVCREPHIRGVTTLPIQRSRTSLRNRRRASGSRR